MPRHWQLPRVLACYCTFLLIAMVPVALGAEPDDAHAALKRMRRPWTEPVHVITPDEYETTLEYWADKHGDIACVERIGVSKEGMRILLLKITDSAVPDSDKQVALITSLHGGPERSGTTTILHLAEWLLGDSPEAVETRRKQVLLLVPIVNPYGFFVTDQFGNSQKIDPYTGGGIANWDLVNMTFRKRDEAPEIAALLSVIDRYRPDVHADAHGTGLQEYKGKRSDDRTQYVGNTMIEVTGSAYSNYALRPWDWRVTEAMIAAGEKAGYGSDRFEADAQRLFWGPGMDPIASRLWLGRPIFYTAQYGYIKYHTMVTAIEVGWEASGVARLRGLLRIGNQHWQGEPTAGYPVDRIKPFVGHWLTAYGATASERRESRVELWQRQGAFAQAMLYPQTDGRDCYIVATSAEAAAALVQDKDQFLRNIANRPGFHSDAVRAFVDAGPEWFVHAELGKAGASASPGPIDRGLGMRLRLPYHNPELLDLRLNGRPLEKSPSEGYQTWFADGFTHVQINIPPEKTKTQSLFVVTCAYLPSEVRRNGWSPPAQVLERLRSKSSKQN